MWQGQAWGLLLFLSEERSQGLLVMEEEPSRHWLPKSWELVLEVQLREVSAPQTPPLLSFSNYHTQVKLPRRKAALM